MEKVSNITPTDVEQNADQPDSDATQNDTEVTSELPSAIANRTSNACMGSIKPSIKGPNTGGFDQDQWD